MKPLLSSFYFGSVEHYRLLARHQSAVIDIGEHYARQSYRTRTSIVGPNGRQDLSVQIVHDHGRKMPVREVRLSYSETWPQQHLHAIRSAYGNAPWFIHYINDLEQVLLTRYERLIDLNMATLELGLRWLGLSAAIEIASEYREEQSPDMFDLRSLLHPKKALNRAVPPVPPYPQVFAARHGFTPRQSIIDLVCNQGPLALHALGA
ncbi:MAG: WbqC family protein [Flavobacteriales bacterium]|jgi:hypothetical protein|nr:WbqC family protein [Flavobacteriales bacterium]